MTQLKFFLSGFAPHIIGGYNAQIKDYPFVCYLEYRSYFICTCTIMRPRKVLTAAHCLTHIRYCIFPPSSLLSKQCHPMISLSGCLVGSMALRHKLIHASYTKYIRTQHNHVTFEQTRSSTCDVQDMTSFRELRCAFNIQNFL